MTYDEGVAHCAASGSTLAAIYDTSELAAARAAISAAGVEKAITSASSDGSGWAWHGTERWEESGFPLNTGQVTDQRQGMADHIYSLHRSEDAFVWDADGRGERHPVLCRGGGGDECGSEDYCTIEGLGCPEDHQDADMGEAYRAIMSTDKWHWKGSTADGRPWFETETEHEQIRYFYHSQRAEGYLLTASHPELEKEDPWTTDNNQVKLFSGSSRSPGGTWRDARLYCGHDTGPPASGCSKHSRDDYGFTGDLAGKTFYWCDNDGSVSVSCTCGGGQFKAVRARSCTCSPEGSQETSKARKKRRFSFHSSPKSWHAAREDCLSRGGDLASIHSEAENREAFALTGGRDTWLGLNGEEDEYNYVWSDGTPMDYHGWAPGEPNNCCEPTDDEDCGGYWSGRNDVEGTGPSWDSMYGGESCGGELAYICSFEAGRDRPSRGSESRQISEARYELAQLRCPSGSVVASTEAECRATAESLGYGALKFVAKDYRGGDAKCTIQDFYSKDALLLFNPSGGGETSGEQDRILCVANAAAAKKDPYGLVFNRNPLSWADAEAHCVSLGGHLATVSSEAMARHIDATFVRGGGACHATWIGYNDRAKEGHWVWAGNASSYTNWWKPSEPNDMDTGEDCASLGVDCIYGFGGVGYHWADSGCSPGDYEYQARASICQVGDGGDKCLCEEDQEQGLGGEERAGAGVIAGSVIGGAIALALLAGFAVLLKKRLKAPTQTNTRARLEPSAQMPAATPLQVMDGYSPQFSPVVVEAVAVVPAYTTSAGSLHATPASPSPNPNAIGTQAEQGHPDSVPVVQGHVASMPA